MIKQFLIEFDPDEQLVGTFYDLITRSKGVRLIETRLLIEKTQALDDPNDKERKQ